MFSAIYKRGIIKIMDYEDLEKRIAKLETKEWMWNMAGFTALALALLGLWDFLKEILDFV